MTDFNLVVVEGRLVRDADLKYSKDGKPFTTFSIASNYWTGKEEAANFFDVVAFEELKLSKGDKIRVQGVLRQDTWEKEGQKMSKIKIIAYKVDKLFHQGTRKQTQEEKTNAMKNFSYGKQTQEEKTNAMKNFSYGGQEINDRKKPEQKADDDKEFKDDIPF